MPEAQSPLVALLEAALSAHLDHDAKVTGLSRFHGGAARETYRFEATFDGRTEGLVVRRDPPASLITTSRLVEYHVLQRAHAAGLPVPEPLLLDEAGTRLGAPGFIMHEMPGGRAAGLFETAPYGPAADATGHALFSALGRLHALTPDQRDLSVLPVQDAAARLAHWKAEIASHRLRPEPIAAAAIRWLEAHMPPPSGPPAIVHGDFRSGNFLVDGSNRLLAILDWEMAHIGDPYEDLAWALDPLWSHGDSARAAATLPRAEAIRCWEESSGRRFDAGMFRWWQLFAGVEGLAIWISSAHEVAKGHTADPVMTFAAVLPYRIHNAQVATMLKELTA